MSENLALNDALEAHHKVKQVVDQLRSRYAAVMLEIENAERGIRSLADGYLPLDDLKGLVSDYLTKVAEECAARAARSVLSMLVTGGLDKSGHAPRYKQLMERFGSHARLGIPPKDMEALFSGEMLYYMCGEFAHERLATLVQSMAASDFGYSAHTETLAGPDRATREEQTRALRVQLGALHEERQSIVHQLARLGASVIQGGA